MRVAIIGNSGSGKSTLARNLKKKHGLAFLELDSIVWEPGQIAIPRQRASVEKELARFLNGNTSWVVEGCYAEIVESALSKEPKLIFLNPGEAICLENNRNRPWEPHKYASKADQDRMLENLLKWVRDYYSRDDQSSLLAHRRLFSEYAGPKTEVVDLHELPGF
jgi:adenylate kinase family enzyme